MASMNPDDLADLRLVSNLIFCLVLGLDFAILIRWVVYRAQRAFRAASVAAQTAGRPSGETGIALASWQEVRCPYAPQWSMADPFFAFQILLVAVAATAAVPGALYAGQYLSQHPGAPPHEAISAVMKTVESAPVTVALLLLQNVLMVGVTAFFLRRYGTSLREIGLKAISWRMALFGVGLGALLLLASGLFEQLYTHTLSVLLSPHTFARLERIQRALSAEGQFLALNSPAARIAFFLAGAVAAPIGEEVFFRGFVYNALERRLNMRAAILLSGLLFAVLHPGPIGIVPIFLMGAVLAAVYARTRSLWVTILMHAVNNSAAFLTLWLTHRS